MLTASKLRSIDQVAEFLGIDRDGVSRFIASGELTAINVNRDRDSKRPTWRVSEESLQEFLAARSTSKPHKPAAATTKKKKPVPAGRVWF